MNSLKLPRKKKLNLSLDTAANTTLYAPSITPGNETKRRRRNGRRKRATLGIGWWTTITTKGQKPADEGRNDPYQFIRSENDHGGAGLSSSPVDRSRARSLNITAEISRRRGSGYIWERASLGYVSTSWWLSPREKSLSPLQETASCRSVILAVAVSPGGGIYSARSSLRRNARTGRKESALETVKRERGRDWKE